ncbi:MAG: O-antigen ligase family protein [Parvularculaceae bacterium]|nr:O-antigen ligase family protein [Parvularculaceae bacterium]
MFESFKALFVVGVLSFGAFAYARIAFSEIVPAATLNRWRNLYLAVTVIAFLTPNYWLMLFVLAGVTLIFGAGEKFKPALYLLLIFAVPAASRVVPGFGGINNFLELYPFNVLAIVLLFPLLFRPDDLKGARGGRITDLAFTGYTLLYILLAFRDTTFTDGIRQSASFILTAIPQYLVFSRIRWTVEKLRLATAALVIPLLALSGVAAAEVVLSWHLYNGAVETWGVDTTLRYVERSGFLRAYGSIFGPIAFGLFLLVGLALAPALAMGMTKRRLAYFSIPALGAGLLATFSRGPWIGGALAFTAYIATTRRSLSNLMRLTVAGIAGLVVLSVSPFGDTIINLLPFIGDVEENTIDYRQRLFEVGMEVAMRNPFFGSENYLETDAMQSLLQGQGIIDIVNTYLRIALDSGFVGLGLYAGAMVFALLAALGAIRPARAVSAELAAYCQGYFAALLGVSVVLATTSNNIAQVQEVTWVLCGMCIGVARAVSLERKGAPAVIENTEVPEPREAPAPTRPLPPHLKQYARR